jgi:hypothetical protein
MVAFNFHVCKKVNQTALSRNCYMWEFTIFVLYLLSGYSDAK